VWSAATYGCNGWKKSEESRIVAVEMNGLRHILLVSWTASVKTLRDYAVFCIVRHCLEKDVIQGTLSGKRKSKYNMVGQHVQWIDLDFERILRITEINGGRSMVRSTLASN